jgi:hypothetical protein
VRFGEAAEATRGEGRAKGGNPQKKNPPRREKSVCLIAAALRGVGGVECHFSKFFAYSLQELVAVLLVVLVHAHPVAACTDKENIFEKRSHQQRRLRYQKRERCYYWRRLQRLKCT